MHVTSTQIFVYAPYSATGTYRTAVKHVNLLVCTIEESNITLYEQVDWLQQLQDMEAEAGTQKQKASIVDATLVS